MNNENKLDFNNTGGSKASRAAKRRPHGKSGPVTITTFKADDTGQRVPVVLVVGRMTKS